MSVKAFSVMCDFGGNKSNVNLQIGYPEPEHHPLHFQGDFLGKSRGGSIPSNIMESLQKIYQLSIENNVDFPELAEYAIKQASLKGDISQSNNNKEDEESESSSSNQ